MKQRVGFVLVLCLLLSLATAGQAAPKKWRAGLVVSRPHPWFDALDYFAEKVKEVSNGEIEVVIYPAGQLGNENVMLSSIGDGSLDIFIGGLSTCSAYSAKVGFCNLGRLFYDQAHFERALAYGGPVDRYFRELMEGVGANFKVLSLTGGGLRNLSARMPVRSIEDLAGVKMRVPNVQAAAAFWEGLGTLPVSMAFTEIYTALQTGVVDAFESTVPSYVSSKLYEVAPYHNKTEHEFMVSIFLMRKDVFDKLSPEMQKAVDKAGVEAGEVAMQSGVELTAALLAELESKGVTLVEVDKDGLQAVAIPLQDQMAAELGMTQLLEDIRSLREEK